MQGDGFVPVENKPAWIEHVILIVLDDLALFEGAAYLRAADPPFEHALDGVRPEDQMTQRICHLTSPHAWKTFLHPPCPTDAGLRARQVPAFHLRMPSRAPIAVDLRLHIYLRH